MKNELPDVTEMCFARPFREHCNCYEEDGYCCDCNKWAPEMCPNKCGQRSDDHIVMDCAPLMVSNRVKFDLITHIYNQREHSLKTFGPLDGGQKVQGILKHIEKELKEIRQNPTDLEEYIDVMILTMDAAYRSGFTPEQIAEMLMKKQVKNERREWPDWREADLSQPLEHVRTPEELLQKAIEAQEHFNFDANGSSVEE